MTIYAPGVWDLLHVGHLNFLEAAARAADTLVVGVQSDPGVELEKGYPPVISTGQRMRLVAALRIVHQVTEYERDFLPALNRYQPDILAIGQDWGTEPRHLDALQWVAQRNGTILRLPRTPGVSTTEIKKRIAQP